MSVVINESLATSLMGIGMLSREVTCDPIVVNKESFDRGEFVLNIVIFGVFLLRLTEEISHFAAIPLRQSYYRAISDAVLRMMLQLRRRIEIWPSSSSYLG